MPFGYEFIRSVHFRFRRKRKRLILDIHLVLEYFPIVNVKIIIIIVFTKKNH